MSYEMHMNLLPDAYREEDYPAPAGFPDLSACNSAFPVMEDHMNLNYVGEPAYNESAGLLSYTASHWDTSVPYRKQDFIDEVRVMPLSVSELNDLSTETADSFGAREFRITAGGTVENRPAVLSDGTVLFLSNASVQDPIPERGTVERRIINELFISPQLYAWKDGTVRKLTHMLHGVNRYLVSPDETFLLFESFCYTETDSPDALKAERTSEERASRMHAYRYTPISYDRLGFKSDEEYGYASRRKKTWWTLSLTDGTLRALTASGRPIVSPVFLPDSSGILFPNPASEDRVEFLCLRFEKPDETPSAYADVNDIIYSYNMPAPVFSKDGTRLLFSAAGKGDSYAAPRMLAAIPAAGGTGLTAEILLDPDDFPGGLGTEDYNFSSRGDDGADLVTYDDGTIVLLSCLNANSGLIRLNPARSEKPEALTGDYRNYCALVPAGRNHVISLFCDDLHMPEAAVTRISGSSPDTVCLTFSNPALSKKQFTGLQSFTYRTLDREEIQRGFVITPAGYDPNQHYPAILHTHGGPSGYYNTAFCLEFQALAAAGFFVIYGNPRGGSGFGRSHGVDEKAYGDIAMNDLICLVDEACRQFPAIDEDRVGITGGSYGGYCTIWGASHSCRYKAASAIRPLANMLMIGASSRNAGGFPGASETESFTDLLINAIHESPNSYADRIQIPFQILQSEKDANCVPIQMDQLYTSLKDLHPELPCRMVLYPDANHGLLHQGPVFLAVMQRIDNQRWFEKYL